MRTINHSEIGVIGTNLAILGASHCSCKGQSTYIITHPHSEWFPTIIYLLDNGETAMNVWQVPETHLGGLNHVVLKPLQFVLQNQRKQAWYSTPLYIFCCKIWVKDGKTHHFTHTWVYNFSVPHLGGLNPQNLGFSHG